MIPAEKIQLGIL